MTCRRFSSIFLYLAALGAPADQGQVKASVSLVGCSRASGSSAVGASAPSRLWALGFGFGLRPRNYWKGARAVDECIVRFRQASPKLRKKGFWAAGPGIWETWPLQRQGAEFGHGTCTSEVVLAACSTTIGSSKLTQQIPPSMLSGPPKLAGL